jgi:hypothetical protein
MYKRQATSGGRPLSQGMAEQELLGAASSITVSSHCIA